MANQDQTVDIDAPYRQEDYDFGPLYGGARAASWTDGLPHDFKGWGPQTPDPDAPAQGGVVFQPESGLSWAGEGDERSYHVWHFDGRRRHDHN
jgi:hypothetical protein